MKSRIRKANKQFEKYSAENSTNGKNEKARHNIAQPAAWYQWAWRSVAPSSKTANLKDKIDIDCWIWDLNNTLYFIHFLFIWLNFLWMPLLNYFFFSNIVFVSFLSNTNPVMKDFARLPAGAKAPDERKPFNKNLWDTFVKILFGNAFVKHFLLDPFCKEILL